MTALHMACQYGHSNIVEILINKSIDFDIDLNAENAEGWTAFYLACQNDHPKIAEMLNKSSKFHLSNF